MNEIKAKVWQFGVIAAVCAVTVVFAQDTAIEELVGEMKAPAETNKVVDEAPVAEVAPAVEAPAVETPAAEAPAAEPAPATETPAATEAPAAEAPAAEKPADVPVIEELTAPATEAAPAIEELIKSEEPTAAPAAEEPKAEPVPTPVAAEPSAPAMAEPAAPEVDRSEMAKILSQQEEVRRQARELEGKKSLETADQAWKDDNFEKALLHYRNAMTKLPKTPPAELMRSRAQARIPECEYQSVLALVRDGKSPAALTRGKELLAQNPDNRPLAKLVARIEKDVGAPKPTSDEPAGTAAAKTEIQKHMSAGKKAMAERDYERSRVSFESVLAMDPDNREAMRYLKELGDREYNVNTTERKATAAKMTAQVRDTWNPQYKVVKAKAETVEKPKAQKVPLLEKMEKIIIPEIEFRQANIHDVVEFLNKASVDGDKDTADQTKRGVNIILNLNPAGAAAAPKPAAPQEDLFGAPAAEGAGGGAPGIEISFTARYVSLMTALKIITSTANLKFRIDGDIVMIVPSDFDPAEIEVRMYPVEPTFIERVREAGTAASEGGESVGGREMTRMNTTELGSGLPTDLKTYFTQMGVRFPAGSSITYNSAIGKVIVGNTAENLAVFERILAELNVVPKQVEIEARFVEVNETDLMEVGLEWLLTDAWELATKPGEGSLLGGSQRIQMNQNSANGGFTRGMRFWGTGGDGAEIPLAAGAGTMGRVASISSVLTNPELTMVLHLLQQNGNADLLSAPKVTTRSGAEASIRVVTEYIYPTSFEVNGGQIGQNNANNNANIVQETTVTPQDFATREVGVLLTVLPEVSPDGNMINLTMQPQVVTEPTWYQYGSTIRRADGSEVTLNMPQPFFHVRALNTSISIYDGATVVMGGLITEDLKKINDKIPFLGDIPLLGALFRNKSERSVKKNLLIFVTAKLVDPAGRLIRQPEDATGAQPAVVPGAPASAPK